MLIFLRTIFLIALSGSALNSFAASFSALPDTSRHVRKTRNIVGFPAVLYSPELTWGFGAAGTYYFNMHRKDTTLRTSFLQGLGLVTLRKQLVFGVDGTIFFPNEKYILKLHGSVSHFPDRFWGLGNNSSGSDMERYTISQYFLFPQLLRNVYKKFFVGAAFEAQQVFYFDYGKPGGVSLFDQQDVPGRHGSFIAGAGLVILWDSRNNTFSPSRGFYAQYYVNHFGNWMGSQYDYLNQVIDVRKYFLVGRESVLAFQFLGVYNTGEVPIRSMANIGSSSIMRGYYEGRYTDKQMMAAQAEYRFPVIWRIGLVGFAGVGRVSDRFSNFQLSNLKPSLGGGIRFALDRAEKLNLRIDAGFGAKSSGVYLNFSEAF